YEEIVAASCCPTILISVDGPYLCIHGGVLADVIIVQPLTDHISMAGHPNDEQRILYVAKVFQEVQSALTKMERWYNNFTRNNATTPLSRGLPDPTHPEISLSQLTIVDRFNYPGREDDPGNMSRSLFTGRLAGVNSKVLVKFCFRYGKEAHRLLALAGLAPKLHLCIPLLGGVTMVVMDLVSAKTAADMYPRAMLPDSVMEDVNAALEMLCEKKLVHGDIRRPNILCCEHGNGRAGAMLIDFDWSGVDGEVTYPALLNRSGEITWAAGVHPGAPIVAQHDEEMMAKLQV
ncbi:hypothetical protein K474DRAFT_1564773, partial [Panus rudis PR-1116 ss-1]